MVEEFRSYSSKLDSVRQMLEKGMNYMIACIDNEKIIGFVLGYELQRYDGKNNMMYIHEVEILDEYRGKGIGKKIMNKLIDICQSKNMSKVFVITNKSNTRAVHLYESTGGKALDDDSIVYWYDRL
nr:GNAT family N-acetyltransferase [Anaerosolibacter carboniphilus]